MAATRILAGLMWIALLLVLSGCAYRIEQAYLGVDKSLAATVRLTASFPKPAPIVSGITPGPVGSAVGATIGSALTQRAPNEDRPSTLKETADACGASYTPRTERDGTRVLVVERKYAALSELDHGLRCAVGSKPPTFSVATADGLLTRSLELRFKYEFSQTPLLSRRQFPDEVVVQLPWSISGIDDKSAIVGGSLKVVRLGDEQISMRVAAPPGSPGSSPSASGTIELHVVAKQLKLELSTTLAALALVLSILTFVFGSGAAKSWFESRRTKDDA